METVVGHRIRVLRARHGLSQSAFGARVGAVQATVSAWEVQGHDPGSEMLHRIAKKFGVTVGWLHGEGAEGGPPDVEQHTVPAELRRAVETASDGDFKTLAMRLLDALDMYGQNMRMQIMEVAAPMARAQEAMARAQEEAQHNIAAVASRLPTPPANKLGAAVVSDPEEVARIRAEILSHEQRAHQEATAPDPERPQASPERVSPGQESGRPATTPSDG